MDSKFENAANRRAHPRQEVDIPGHLFVGEQGHVSYECRLIDLSMGGACVVLKKPVQLPSAVRLLETLKGNVFECQVRWQTADKVGLHFIDMCSQAARRELLDRAAGSERGGFSNQL